MSSSTPDLADRAVRQQQLLLRQERARREDAEEHAKQLEEQLCMAQDELRELREERSLPYNLIAVQADHERRLKALEERQG